jgi:hypothetical protein
LLINAHKMARPSPEAGILSRQKINIHTVGVLILLGFGSVTAGYSAAVMGITSGKRSMRIGPEQY